MSHQKFFVGSVSGGMRQILKELEDLRLVLLAIIDIFKNADVNKVRGILGNQNSVEIPAAANEWWVVKFSLEGELEGLTFVWPKGRCILFEMEDSELAMCVEDISHPTGVHVCKSLDPFLWGLKDKFPFFASAVQLYVDAAKRAGLS